MSSSRHSGNWVSAFLLVGVPIWISACGTSPDNAGSGGGGSSGTSGSAGSAGIAASGGGGTSTGGTSTAGTGTGGATSGGTSAGGTSAGASPSGGGVSGAGGLGTSGGAAGAATGGTSGGGAGASAGSAGASGGKSGSGGSSGSCTTSTMLKSGDTTMMLTVGGMERSFIVHAPPSYDGTTRMPVVFDFHGLGGTANMWRNASRWRSVGDSQGFITVYPQGLADSSNRPGWNAGGCCNTVADDVAFVRAMITHLASNACIDGKRIHATGCSNGGAMSYMLACRAPDVIASVAPVDFDCVVGGQCSQCMPARPITEIQFRGTNDTAVPYGMSATQGARANFTRWGTINQCTGTPGELPANGACQTYPVCGAGVETILCTVQNGSHCGSYSSFMIPELAWEVLTRHPLP